MKSLKQFAYLHLRALGLPPKESLRLVRCAISSSLAIAHREKAFETCFNYVCQAICFPICFEV